MSELTWLANQPEEMLLYKLTSEIGNLACKVVSALPLLPQVPNVVAIPGKSWGPTWSKRCLGKEQVLRHRIFRLETGVSKDQELVTGVQLDVVIIELKVAADTILTVADDVDVIDIGFTNRLDGALLFPDADNLMEIARKHTGVEEDFSTGVEDAAGTAPSGAVGMRLDNVEKDMAGINSSLKSMEALLAKLHSGKAAKPTSASAASSSQAKSPSPVIPDDVEKEAMSTGISKEQLAQLAPLLKGSRGLAMESHAPSKAQITRKQKVSVLDEADEENGEESEGDDEDDGGSEATVAKCLMQLTKLTREIAGQHSKSKQTKLEDLLSGSLRPSSSLTSDSLSSVTSSKGAQGFSALQRLLSSSDAKLITQMVEKNMHSANSSSEGTTETAGGAPNPLFYLEHRSRVTAHEGHCNWLWMTAHALKALTAGRTDEAVARLYLMLAAGEQVSLDGGSWVMGLDYALCSEPPMAAFATHQPSSSRDPHSHLVDARYHDLIWNRIDHVDKAVERKRKIISQPRWKPNYNKDKDKDRKAKGDPKGDPKGKGKGADDH